MNSKEKIVYIPIKEIAPHKDNPRKAIGDITELAESIKLHGILQNLTVVPIDGAEDGGAKYTAIIGHRRLAAAASAGLEEVPCVVREMSEADQIRTMLLENISRVDLTPYEQAQGFQMMLDLGDTVADISERTGFSSATVRRRVKLLDLDQAAFQEAADRGATLFDLAKLEEIEDADLKNKALAAAGTSNFQNQLLSAAAEQKRRKKIAEWSEQAAAFAKKIDKADYSVMTCCENHFTWDGSDKATIERPEDADTVKYWYAVNGNNVSIYKVREICDNAEAEAERERAQKEREEADRKFAELKEMAGRHFELREAFVANYGKAKSSQKKIMDFAGDILFAAVTDYVSGTFEWTMVDMLDLDVDVENDTDEDLYRALKEALAENPERRLLLTAYAAIDNDTLSYFTRQYIDGKTRLIYRPNDDLDGLYAFLCSLGYQMSDEEKQMQNGEHPYLEGAEAEC